MGYFHLVFTLPELLASIVLQNKRALYGMLFRASAQTLREVAADPKHLGAEIGFLSVLHTWGQNMLHHPHVHCVVPAGGLAPDGTRWIDCRKNFFLPVRVLSRVFRGKFLELLNRAYHQGQLKFEGRLAGYHNHAVFQAVLNRLYRQEWVVYAKPPFGGPERVLKYLARYTHRVAISNQRLVSMDDEHVTFQWKDYAHGQQRRTMTLTAVEFIRRFLLHVLPQHFVRIRQYGFLANCRRQSQLDLCRRLLNAPAAPATEPAREVKPASLTDQQTTVCPHCGVGHMRTVERIPRRTMQQVLYSRPFDTS